MKRSLTLILVLGLVAAISLAGCERSVPDQPTPTLQVVMSPQAPPVSTQQVPTTVSVLEQPQAGTPTPTVIWDLPTFTPTPPGPVAPTATLLPGQPTSAPVATATTAPSGNVSHTVVWGDTLYSLAAQYDTSVEAIAQANNLSNAAFIRVGQVLTIPQGQPGGGSVPPSSGQQSTYTVQSGDTMYSIASRYGTTVAAIAQANGIVNPAYIRPGQVLIIPGSTGEAPSQGSNTYVVQPGDTLTSIAARYGTTVWAIVTANNLPNQNWLSVGQTLIIPAP